MRVPGDHETHRAGGLLRCRRTGDRWACTSDKPALDDRHGGAAHRSRSRKVFLLNDLQATAYALPQLQPKDLHTINTGTPLAHGAIAVIAPGTGLGEAFLVWGESGYVACSSEGGHASFAPTDQLQVALWRYLNDRFGHVSVERVCS